MVHDLISVKYAIETVYRDYGHQEELDIWDCVEWAGEALGLMHVGQQYIPKVISLTTEGHRVCLPHDFYSIQNIEYKGDRLPSLSGTIGRINDKSNNPEIPVGKLMMLLKDSPQHQAKEEYDAGYYINDGFIITSFEEDTFRLSYLATPLDEEGFPKMPNMDSYKKAIAAYIQLMLDRRDWRAGRIQDKVFQYSEQQWKKYCNMAKADALFPTFDEMENIKRSWVALRPASKKANNFYR